VEDGAKVGMEVELEIIDMAFFTNQLKEIMRIEELCKINEKKDMEGLETKKMTLSKFVTQYFYNVVSVIKLFEYPQLAYDYFFVKLYGPCKPLVGQYITEIELKKKALKDNTYKA